VTQQWAKLDPIDRLVKYLKGRGVLQAGDLERLQAQYDEEVRTTLAEVEKVAPVPLESMFEDVFAKMPAHLRAQLAEARTAQAER